MRRTGPSPEVRQEVAERAGYCCEVCGLGVGVYHFHHRKPRQMGGTKDPRSNLPQNLMYVHPSCHAWIEKNRDEARERGWLLTHYEETADA